MDEDVVLDLASVYEAYHGKVVSYAAKLLGREQADDIGQEVFVKIGRSLQTLSDPSKLASWVYAITLNTVRDAVRRRAAAPDRGAGAASLVRDEAEAGSPLDLVPDTSSRTPEEAAIHSEMVACFLEYLRRLPPRYHEVYVLSEFDHLAIDEIARRLSISVGAAKIRLHRARAQLNDALRRNCRCYTNERGELMGEPKGG